jgi:hypothetical protein
MTTKELFAEYTKLDEPARNEFMTNLMMYCDIHLPDSKFLIVPFKEYQRLVNGRRLIAEALRFMENVKEFDESRSA